MADVLPLPNVRHGRRVAISVIEERAETEPDSPWVSVPVDENDLTHGYKDLTYGQLRNAANHAVHWLARHVEAASFAYAGPLDVRYPILAVAAGKLGKVMVLPGPLMTPEAQLRILEKTSCSVYVRTTGMTVIDGLKERNEHLQIISAPELDELMQPAEAVPFTKSWDEVKDEPWLVFHTSGTTGHPKPITYTHRMMAIPDLAASLKGISETHVHQYATQRWYTPMPMMHFVGMLMVLSMSAFIRTVVVLGPKGLSPAPDVVKAVLKHGRVNGALLVPSQIDALCRDADGLAVLRALKYIHYVGSSLGVESGAKLSPYVCIVPSIGSTEAGGYFTKIRAATEDWDYVEFQPEAGAEFEPHIDSLHELVFVRRADAPMQQIFMVHPTKDRHATSDLWIEHPHHKGRWKIVGRTDDYVHLAYGGGLHASLLEPEIERHALVRAALIGGHGRPRPVLLIEPVPGAQRQEILRTLQPYVDRVNAQCHELVQLSPDDIIFTKEDKPLVRTIKGSVARVQSLKLYESEIEELSR